MVAVVLLFSAAPTVFSLGGASKTPFLFVAFIYLATVINHILYLMLVYPHKANTKTLKTILNNLWHPAIILVAFTRFGYVLFAFALRYVDESIAAVLMEISYIFTVIIMELFFNKSGRYKKLTLSKYALLGLALVGVGFVIVSQSSTLDNAFGEIFTHAGVVGIGLILIAALLSSLSLPTNQLWGAYVCSKTEETDEVFYTIVSNVVVRSIIIPVLLVIGLVSGETIQGIGVAYAVVYGFVGHGLGTVFFLIANARTSNLGINGLCYFIPAMSLSWLGLAGLIDVAHLDWLIIGLLAIMLANLLLNVNAEIRARYKQLIVGAWVVGAALYLSL